MWFLPTIASSMTEIAGKYMGKDVTREEVLMKRLDEKARFSAASIPDLWSKEIVESYKKGLSHRDLMTSEAGKALSDKIDSDLMDRAEAAAKAMELSQPRLLEGGIVHRDTGGSDDMLLLGFVTSNAYGERAICAWAWRSRRRKFSYHFATELTYTGRDDLVAAADILAEMQGGNCPDKLRGIQLHDIRS